MKKTLLVLLCVVLLCATSVAVTAGASWHVPGMISFNSGDGLVWTTSRIETTVEEYDWGRLVTYTVW